jgi:hypothetical protein
LRAALARGAYRPFEQLIAFCRNDLARWERYAQVARPLGYHVEEALRLRLVGVEICTRHESDDRAFTAIEMEWLEGFAEALAEHRYTITIRWLDRAPQPHPDLPALLEDRMLSVSRGILVVHPRRWPSFVLLDVKEIVSPSMGVQLPDVGRDPPRHWHDLVIERLRKTGSPAGKSGGWVGFAREICETAGVDLTPDTISRFANRQLKKK